MTLMSRVLGLARDIVVAFFFGSSAAADAFFLAFKIPNFFRRLFAEGAFSQAFVPVLSQYKSQESPQALKDLIDNIAGVLSIALAIFVGIGVLFSGGVISLFALGYLIKGETAQLELAGSLLAITFPYLGLVSLTAFAGSILNTFGRFAVPSFTPVLLNVSLIASAIWLRPFFDVPVFALAWGVFIAGWLQLLFQWPALARLGLVPKFKLGFRHPGVMRVGVLMLPALLGVSVSQINLLLDTVLARFCRLGVFLGFTTATVCWNCRWRYLVLRLQRSYCPRYLRITQKMKPRVLPVKSIGAFGWFCCLACRPLLPSCCWQNRYWQRFFIMVR